MCTPLVVVGGWSAPPLFTHRLPLGSPPPSPPWANGLKGIRTREGLRALMAAPMHLFTKSTQRMKGGAAQRCGGGGRHNVGPLKWQ